MEKGKVLSVSLNAQHTFSKVTTNQIELLKGLGVKGDAHCGEKVKHRSRVAKNPDQPNLRQVHLIHDELFQDLATKGFQIKPGEMGENITTSNIDLLNLPKDTILKIGGTAQIQITGLRNPCHQIDTFKKGLLKAVVNKGSDNNIVRKAGIMGIVLEGGIINVNDNITIVLPPKPFIKLERV